MLEVRGSRFKVQGSRFPSPLDVGCWVLDVVLFRVAIIWESIIVITWERWAEVIEII
jgi:hypothetical protein